MSGRRPVVLRGAAFVLWPLLLGLSALGYVCGKGTTEAAMDTRQTSSGPRAGLASSATFRIATYNVNRGLDPETLARSIARDPELARADVLMLQEVETVGASSPPHTLAERLGLSLLYAPARSEGGRTHGVALLSRHRLLDPEVVSLTRYDLGYRSRDRVALAATIELDGHRLRLFNTHLDTRLTLSQRLRQMEPLVSRSTLEPHAVVGGDVNTIRAVPALLPLFPLPLPGLGQAAGLDAFMRGHGFETPLASLGATGPLGMRLDAIFTRGVSVSAAGKGRRGASDHLPLWLDLSLSLPHGGD